MDKTITIFRLTHRITLAVFVMLVAFIPLTIAIDVTTAFVILPTFLVFLFTLSIIIEQKLDRLALGKTKTKKRSFCLLMKCYHKSCLS